VKSLECTQKCQQKNEYPVGENMFLGEFETEADAYFSVFKNNVGTTENECPTMH
jgi:hypothetical protein